MFSFRKETIEDLGSRPAHLADEMFGEGFIESIFKGNLLEAGDVKTAFPKVNQYWDGGEYVIEAAVTGYTKDEIHVTVTPRQLTISGEKHQGDTRKYTVKELKYSSFSRSWELTTILDHKTVTCKLENGLLIIRIGKSKTVDSATKEIPIE